MKEQTYSLPENPAFHDEIRRLQRRDYADAEDTFNPLIQMILENILAVKILLQSHDVDGNAHADIRDLLGGGVGELKRILDAHTVNTDNPHQTDYTQTGADKAGSAAAVLEELTNHNVSAAAHEDIRTALNGKAPVAHTHGDYLPLTGGTLTGDLRIKGSGNYGTKINLGDGDYVHLAEPTDDNLEIKAKNIELAVSGKVTINGTELAAQSVPATNGTAEYARGLATARSIRTNLSSSYAASFNGRSDVSPGVTGTLPVANGGTGQSGYTFNDSSTRYRGIQLMAYTPSSVSNGCISLVYI